jgi:hypothetical protein
MRSVTAAADAVWNRACAEARGPKHLSKPGDRALADMILAHSLAMNGGVLHALESLSRMELTAALDGYRYFGLDSAARALEYVSERRGDDLDDDALDRLEVEADERYASVVPDDESLVRRSRLATGSHPTISRRLAYDTQICRSRAASFWLTTGRARAARNRANLYGRAAVKLIRQ